MEREDVSRRGGRWLAGLGLMALVLGGGLGLHIVDAQAPKPGGWLGALPADKQIEAIDRQLRCFDMAMFEVNYRYTEMYFGAIEGNWDDALDTGRAACNACHAAEAVAFIRVGIPAIKQAPLVNN
jgi:hypothetical protein